MKASELRIGNLIEFMHHTMGWSQPTACEAWMITDCIKYPETYRSITLTEEWLLKFGFERLHFNNYQSYYSNRLIMIVFHNNGNHCIPLMQSIFYNRNNIFDRSITINFQYIHQLQNLYFAITGEELTLK